MTLLPFKPPFLISLKTSPHVGTDALSHAWKPKTRLRFFPFTPMTIRTGTLSTILPIRISHFTRDRNRYLIGSSDKSRFLHLSTESINSLTLTCPRPFKVIFLSLDFRL